MYESLIAEATGLLKNHFQSIYPNEGETAGTADGKVKTVIDAIREEGGTDADGLRQFSWEDLQRCGAPLALAKRLAQIFRAPAAPESKTYISEKRARQMSPAELVAAYDPRDVRSHVAPALRELAKDRPFIVFNADGSVNVVTSTKCLLELVDGEEPRATVIVEGRPHPLFKVGERPAELADENPLYPGRALRSDGTCTQTNRSWEGVSQEVRLLLHIARKDTGELSVGKLDDAHNAMDMAVADGAVQKIRLRYTKASMEYDRLKAAGILPTLKVPRGAAGQDNFNPFPANRVR